MNDALTTLHGQLQVGSSKVALWSVSWYR